MVEKRRRLPPEQRRALIVAAAAEEFGRRGHRDARMEDIARAAGVTKAVLYDHFPSKGSLHAEVVSRASDELTAAVTEAALAESDPRERFRAALRTTFEVIAARPDVRSLLFGEPGADRLVGTASRKAQRRARAALAALYLYEPRFMAGRPDREKRAEHIAQASMGLVNALAALGVEQRLSPEYLADLAFELLDPSMAVMATMPVLVGDRPYRPARR
jgi:AcrR family transcriptional regulator